MAGSVIDRELSLSRVGGDEELLKEIVILFLEDYPKVIADLRDAAARGDAKGVERNAHSLKGSVSNFGAQMAVDTALKLESMGRAHDLDDVSPLLDTLDQTLAVLKRELESL